MSAAHPHMIYGPLSPEEKKVIVMLWCEAEWCRAAIARHLNRSVQSINAFLHKLDADRALAAAEAQAAERLNISQSALGQVEAAELETIVRGWTTGLPLFSILGRVNKARRAGGLAAMDTPELHRIVVQQKLRRPDVRRAA